MTSPVNTWTAERTGLGENLNPETLLAWQKEKLKTLVEYAHRNSRYYSEKLQGITDLKELSFTNPTDIVDDPFAFLAIPQSQVARVTTFANSGTTRLKKRIFFSKADLERTVDFFSAGMSTMVQKGEHAQILISNKTENSLGSLLLESLSKIGVRAEISGVIKTADKAIHDALGVDCLIGLPSELLYMSRIAPDLRPNSVLLAADYIPQSVIDSLKETWKCCVFSHYGHTEFGFGCAVDCEQHDGYHLRDADLIFEIIDPETGLQTNPGERGEVVITTVSSEAMPLIRYRTGHISRFISSPCACSSKLPRLGRIEGRIESKINVGNESTISIHQLDEILFADPVIRGFDASLHHIRGKFTLHLTVDAQGIFDLNSLAEKLPQGLNIAFTYGKADPFSRRGKRRIREVL